MWPSCAHTHTLVRLGWVECVVMAAERECSQARLWVENNRTDWREKTENVLLLQNKELRVKRDGREQRGKLMKTFQPQQKKRWKPWPVLLKGWNSREPDLGAQVSFSQFLFLDFYGEVFLMRRCWSAHRSLLVWLYLSVGFFLPLRILSNLRTRQSRLFFSVISHRLK